MKRIFTWLALAWPAFSAHAIPIISVDPEMTEAIVGSRIAIAVSIAEPDGEIIGDYDVTLAFDEGVLDLADIAFGPFLDAPDSLQEVEEHVGSVDVFEISFGDLLGQDGSTPFSLFTAEFDVIGSGATSLGLFVSAIGGFFGEPLDVEARGASVTAVPEPGAALLLSGGLLLLLSRVLRLHPRREASLE